MAFVFMGKGVRELQEGNILPITPLQGFPHVEAMGIFPSVEGLLAQLLLIVLFIFALAKTFWPKRSVTLPTVMPPAPTATPVLVASAELSALRAEHDELRRRLVALEEAVGREPAGN
jgi:hypothetical protein